MQPLIQLVNMISVKNNQSLFDVAIEHSGAMEAVVSWAFSNGLSMTDDLEAAMELVEPKVVDTKIATLFGNLYNKPATALTREMVREFCDAVGANTAEFDTFTNIFDNTFHYDDTVSYQLPYTYNLDLESNWHWGDESKWTTDEIEVPMQLQQPDKVEFWIRQTKGASSDNGVMKLYLRYISTDGTEKQYACKVFVGGSFSAIIYINQLPTTEVTESTSADISVDISSLISDFDSLVRIIVKLDVQGNGYTGEKNLVGVHTKIKLSNI